MLNNVLFILLGAGLVIVGFLAAALAERFHGSPLLETPESPETQREIERLKDELARSERMHRHFSGPASRGPRPSSSHPIDDPAEMPRTPTITRATRATRQAAPSSGDDVIAALMAAGYKRPIAAEATWGCNEAERTTIENWTAAALRRCGRGAL